MPRSNSVEKVQRLNVAFDLLSQGWASAQATAMLADEFGMSSRQATRYVVQAQSIKHPVPVASPSVAITIKVPEDIAVKLRAHAQATNTTIGDVVSRAVLGLLAVEHRRG
jgi:predicted DNA-binding transcriptional regulator YafY